MHEFRIYVQNITDHLLDPVTEQWSSHPAESDYDVCSFCMWSVVYYFFVSLINPQIDGVSEQVTEENTRVWA
jgi:hypothetical protein